MATQRLIDRIRRDFSPLEADTVIALVDELSTLDGDETGTERVQAAVVLLALGDSRRLLDALALAWGDWRDVLMAAGLAHDDWPDRLAQALDHQQTARTVQQRSTAAAPPNNRQRTSDHR